MTRVQLNSRSPNGPSGPNGLSEDNLWESSRKLNFVGWNHHQTCAVWLAMPDLILQVAFVDPAFQHHLFDHHMERMVQPIAQPCHVLASTSHPALVLIRVTLIDFMYSSSFRF